MIRWLEGNLFGQVLASVAGVLLVSMLVLGVIWSLPPNPGPDEGGGQGESLTVDVASLPDSPPIESFAVVTDRPVFNESRQPELESDAEGGEDGMGDQEEEIVDAPELKLVGVVITPTLRMVTLRERQPAGKKNQGKKRGESLVAFEGQPLHGDYGSWHVSQIAPRDVTLASADGRELQLRLEVHKQKMAPPKAPPPAKTPQEDEEKVAAQEGDEDRPMTRAEEIRQRIAERREELRQAAEAERSGEKEPSDYQTAIRSMIGARNTSKENDDDQ